jgi:hypothetical protein
MVSLVLYCNNRRVLPSLAVGTSKIHASTLNDNKQAGAMKLGVLIGVAQCGYLVQLF